MKHSTTSHLPIPKQEPAGPGSFDYRPHSVEDWLQNLPVVNLSVTSRAVYESLQACNRQQLHPSLRLRYLEQLREIVCYIGNGLRKQYMGRALPLRPKPKGIVTLALLLLQEMALGYEILIETAHSQPRPAFGHHQRRACALDRAIRYRSQVLLESWVVYQAPPTDTWRRLHTLYAIAEAAGLSEQRVIDSQLASRRHRSTPGRAYRQVVLLAAAGPQRMHHSEILDAYRLLEQWAAVARLVAPEDPAASEALFWVPHALDAPPQPYTVGSTGPQDRLLLTDALQRLTEREFSTTTKGLFGRRKALADIHPELSRRLSLALGAVTDRRRQSRMRITARILAVPGLTAIHRALSHELGEDVETIDPAHDRFQCRNAPLAEHEAPDVWDLIYPAELLGVMPQEPQRSIHDLPHHSRHEETLDWSLINVSAGGYCLVSGPQQNSHARVGELIAMREMTDRKPPWQLGAIRWMRVLPEQTLQIGVQILASSPSPIQLRAEHAEHRFGPLERGLLLPAVTATDQSATLIAPGRNYAAQRRARVRYGQRETAVKLSREIDATAHYVQLEFCCSDLLEAEETVPDVSYPQHK
ncbi:hypothetical protein [Nitrococcus mobilis]|uniref:GTPase-translation elongation factors n=1 Tax=Nitrococcus mobilis Nb-231 TaxID=314278 RepID=A4BSY7_9GAMM|nr:hypothetical protein [Nitrococcus mobilis]EAR21231.1 GTPase - translation elongation factors [Nitrococcus mobilis Nb-231]